MWSLTTSLNVEHHHHLSVWASHDDASRRTRQSSMNSAAATWCQTTASVGTTRYWWRRWLSSRHLRLANSLLLLLVVMMMMIVLMCRQRASVSKSVSWHYTRNADLTIRRLTSAQVLRHNRYACLLGWSVWHDWRPARLSCLRSRGCHRAPITGISWSLRTLPFRRYDNVLVR